MDLGSSSGSTVGVLIKTVADNGAITQTQAELTMLDQKAQGAGKSAATTTSSFENFGKTLGKVGSQVSDIGRTMSTGLTLPIAGIAYESAKMAMTFQQTMEMLHTNAGTAQKDIAGLSDAVLNMAPEVGAKPEELAQALYHIASAGNGIWTTAKQLDILKISAEGAAIGQASLDDTTYSLTSTMASNIKGAQDASQAMSTLVAIVGAGDMHMQDLNAAIGTGFLGTAASFGISLQSVGAALATLTDNGEHADAAATRLRMTWALMASPSKQATGILQDLGLTADGAAQATDQMNTVFAKTGLSTTKLATDLQQPNGMNVALKDLQDHLQKAGLNAAETDSMLAKAFGGGRTDAAMLTMLQNLDRTDEKFKMINDSSSQFSEKWAAQQATAKQQWDKAWGGIEADMIRLGIAIMPQVTHAMNDIAKAVSDVTNWFEHLSGGQKQFVIDAAGVIAAIGPVLVIFGTLAGSISKIIDLTTTLGGLMRVQMVADAEAGATGTLTAFGKIVTGMTAAGGIVAVLFGLGQLISDITDKWSRAQSNFKNNNGVGSSPVGSSPDVSLNANSFTNGQLTKHATGTNYAAGGWSWVGENGPEPMYIPRGSQILTNGQSNMSSSPMNGGSNQTVTIGTVVLQSPAAAKEFFQQLNQDTMNLGKGLTANQGVL